MKGSSLIDLEKNLNSNKPFYKRRLFFIGIGLLSLIILIIIIIIIVSSSTISFSSNNFIESKEFIKNPDQGFYRPVIVTITPSNFKNSTNKPDQIYHLRCDISEFSGAVNSDGKDIKLTDNALNRLDEYLNKIKLENKNAVIRFSYDPNYGGKTNTEPSLSMIEEHIKQLSKILNKHLDTLTAIEAGMLGPWGEMHTSKIATNENKALVFKYWLENTQDIPILGRTPKALFTYFNKSLDEMEKYKINKNDKGYRLGLFNDCYLSSNNDVGTYTINRTREVNWLSNQNQNLPYGGETCAVHSMSDAYICLPEMRLLCLSYLNKEYLQDVYKKWNNIKYDSNLGKDSTYYDISVLDYINAHLGYRLVIRSIDINYKKRGKYDLNINIENVGFGNLLKIKNVDIIYTDLNNIIIKRQNVGTYMGENILKIKGELLEKDNQDYKVFICLYSSIENNIIYYPIQFANENIYNNKLKSNLIFSVKNGGEIF